MTATTVLTKLARPRVEAEAAKVNGLEIAVGWPNVPALRRVAVSSSSRGGRATGRARTGAHTRSQASPRGRIPPPFGGASMGNSGVATRIEPVPGLSLPQLAAIHEFGAPSVNVPERAPMRRAFADSRSMIRRHAVKILTAVAQGKRTGPLIDAMAAAVRKAVQEAIRTTTAPPMSPRHRARRIALGDSNPQLLFDVEQLHDEVQVTVTKGGRL